MKQIVLILIITLTIATLTGSIALQQYCEKYISGCIKRPPPNWNNVKLSSGAVLYMKQNSKTIQTVRILFPGARQSVKSAIDSPIIKELLKINDSLVCVLGKRGFDSLADTIPTYISLTYMHEDAAAAVSFVKQYNVPIYLVGYSMGCNDALSVVHDNISGIVLIAPILEDVNLRMLLWGMKNARIFHNIIRLFLYKIMLPWLVVPIDIKNLKVPYKIFIGKSDIYGYMDNIFITVDGGHKTCMKYVKSTDYDFDIKQ